MWLSTKVATVCKGNRMSVPFRYAALACRNITKFIRWCKGFLLYCLLVETFIVEPSFSPRLLLLLLLPQYYSNNSYAKTLRHTKLCLKILCLNRIPKDANIYLQKPNWMQVNSKGSLKTLYLLILKLFCYKIINKLFLEHLFK